ncbi:MAG: hypothetical protein DCF22_13825 [Leptolyngbya sp.]|nr:MAG: hypothetical protein DCF22_13825 [Leptolyngbya sp.]
MTLDYDHYAIYYADKLWHLLPAIYRAEDSQIFERSGPLREMVNRIGVQAAILRRSTDRLWEDQFIETCDDWVIAYMADLLATNLVASLDARGQRLDVAKTIYYRRRKGTVAILEEIATDITGWNARVVEFFRRVSRTRHSLDPEIGLPSETPDPAGNRILQQSQGLVGALTKTPIGGWADLRQVYGATKAHSAFDEFFSTADMRRGKAQVGWYNIPRLGVFLWRLLSFPAGEPIDSPQTRTAPNRGIGVTPVQYQACPDHYTFDPTGREIPLFAAAFRPFGDRWSSPAEWQLPTAISKPLLDQELQHLYAVEQGRLIRFNSLGIFDGGGKLIPFEYVLQDASGNPVLDPDGKPIKVKITADSRGWSSRKDKISFLIDPEKGKVIKGDRAPTGVNNLLLTYHYGFSSTIGAGAFDRRILRQPNLPTPNPQQAIIGGDNALATPLTTLASIGTLTIQDSLTYTQVSNLDNIQRVTLRAENNTRPLIRLPAPAPTAAEWVFSGTPGSELILEGLLISGGDLVLAGSFDKVTLRCCTLDPGETANAPAPSAKAVDGRDLIPCHLWITGQVRQLTIDRCILGPIRSRGTGAIATLTITDSILQSLGTQEVITLNSGMVNLTRCTILGRATVHQLEASECILNDVVTVENYQQGCVRFTAWAKGSTLPRPYESVETASKAPVFTSRRFGQPGYAQLQLGADAAIIAGQAGATIIMGAQDGSEMGAFAREKNPIKERSLRIKYEEYMPLGLIPVMIYVT